MTLGYSLLSAKYLEKMVYDGWLGTLIIISPFLDVELEIDWMINHGSS